MKTRRLVRVLLNRRSTGKGIIAGLAGGLAGAWAMNQFQAVWSSTAEKIHQTNASDGNGSANGNQSQNENESSEDATMKTANRISTGLLRRPLSKEQKKKAGPIVHYAFGGLMGGLYGAAVENSARAKAALGVPFGAALFLAADEVAVPLFGLSESPLEYPWNVHVQALATHLVYGVTTEVVRKGVRTAFRLT